MRRVPQIEPTSEPIVREFVRRDYARIEKEKRETVSDQESRRDATRAQDGSHSYQKG